MTSIATDVTPLVAAEAALAEADSAIEQVRRETAGVEEKFAAWREQLDTAQQTRGADSKDARTAGAAMTKLTPELLHGRDRLERAERVRSVAARRVASEQQAIRAKRTELAAQEQREANQVEAQRKAHGEAQRTDRAVEVEHQRTEQLRFELATLTGEEGDL